MLMPFKYKDREQAYQKEYRTIHQEHLKTKVNDLSKFVDQNTNPIGEDRPPVN